MICFVEVGKLASNSFEGNPMLMRESSLARWISTASGDRNNLDCSVYFAAKRAE